MRGAFAAILGFGAEARPAQSDFGRILCGAATFVGAASGGDEASGISELHLLQRPAAVEAGGLLRFE